jgi:hypothetical protein
MLCVALLDCLVLCCAVAKRRGSPSSSAVATMSFTLLGIAVPPHRLALPFQSASWLINAMPSHLFALPWPRQSSPRFALALFGCSIACQVLALPLRCFAISLLRSAIPLRCYSVSASPLPFASHHRIAVASPRHPPQHRRRAKL